MRALKGNEQLARDALRVSDDVEDRALASLMRVLVSQQFPDLSPGGGEHASQEDLASNSVPQGAITSSAVAAGGGFC